MIIVFGQYHSSLINCLEAMGQPYFVLKDAKRYADKQAIDFSDETTVLATLHRLTPAPTTIIAMYEQYIPLAAKMSQALGLRHSLSPQAALKATDKIAMRTAFDSAPGISPAHTQAGTLEHAKAFVKRYGYPVIIKPANLSKSMLISRCDNDMELEAAYEIIRQTAPELYKKYTLGQTPAFIIEQFMEGSIHTVAAFVDRDGHITFAPGIVDNISAREAGYNDNFIFQRTLPTTLTAEQQDDTFACAEKAIRALGLRSCPAHVEIIMTSAGARIIEIGARLGGYRPLMYELSSGINLLEAAIESYQGKQVDITSTTKAACAVIELFPTSNGRITQIQGFDTIATLASAHKVRQAKVVGDTAGRAADGYKAVGYVVLTHESSDMLARDTATIKELFSVTVG